MLVSEDIGRSMRLSAPLLPGVLLFFLIAEHFDGLRDMRRLYLTFSIVGLGLGSALLWCGWKNGWRIVNVVPGVGSPLLIVRNDSTFLALLAPLSFALFYREPRGLIGSLAALSMLLSIGAVVCMRSRTAGLTMMISLMCASALMQPRRRLMFGLMCGLVVLAFALFIDGLLGFPFSTKITNKWTLSGRTGYWSIAWTMFLAAPMLGQGPHTYGLFHKTPWPHNLYLEVLAEQGLLGLPALGCLLASGLSIAWQLQRAVSDEVRLLAAGALAAWVGFCSAAAVELSLIRQWVVIILFALLGVIAQLASSQPTRRVD